MQMTNFRAVPPCLASLPCFSYSPRREAAQFLLILLLFVLKKTKLLACYTYRISVAPMLYVAATRRKEKKITCSCGRWIN